MKRAECRVTSLRHAEFVGYGFIAGGLPSPAAREAAARPLASLHQALAEILVPLYGREPHGFAIALALGDEMHIVDHGMSLGFRRANRR